MKRDEFSAKTKDLAARRANGRCECCYLPFGGARPEFDHVLPAADGGKATLSNCQVLCRNCHNEKSKLDIGRIRKGNRQRRAASGAKRLKAKIPQRPKPDKPQPKPKAPRRRDVFGRLI